MRRRLRGFGPWPLPCPVSASSGRCPLGSLGGPRTSTIRRKKKGNNLSHQHWFIITKLTKLTNYPITIISYAITKWTNVSYSIRTPITNKLSKNYPMGAKRTPITIHWIGSQDNLQEIPLKPIQWHQLRMSKLISNLSNLGQLRWTGITYSLGCISSSSFSSHRFLEVTWC